MVVVEYSILQCMFFSWKYIDFTEKCCCLFVFFFVVTNLCIVPSNILSFSLLLVVVSICILFTNRKKPLIFFFETFLNFRNSFFCVKTTCILYKVILFQVQLENCVLHCSENEANVFSVWKISTFWNYYFKVPEYYVNSHSNLDLLFVLLDNLDMVLYTSTYSYM